MRPWLALLVLALAASPALAAPAPAAPRWLVGDWHVHTSASHDACDPAQALSFVTAMDPRACGDGPHTLSARGSWRMLEAETRGLDYVRITDHNTLEGARDAASHEGRVVLVPGYEHSLPGGHAGITTLDLPQRGVFATPPAGAEGLHALLDEVRAAPGGLFVANHPADGDGPAWSDPALDWSRVDAVEIWNIHWAWRDDVARGLVPTSENDEALALWTSLLDRGHRLAALGGSDSHWIATSGAQGIGQPATWVLADDATPEAIIAAARAGRTYVAADFAAPRVALEARPPHGAPLGLGDEAPAHAPVLFHARVLGAAGDEARLVSCRGVEASARLAPEVVGLSATLVLPSPCWVRLDVVALDDELGPPHLLYRAITSPIYVR